MQLEGRADRRPGAKICFEDLAILLRLIQLKCGGFPKKDYEEDASLYDHLVVDEAQDFGAVELTVLLSAVRSRTGVTIVGDVNQKIIPEADFIGWDELAKELGIAGVVVTKLEIAHRSTAPIMTLANSIVGDADTEGRAGAKPGLSLHLDASSRDQRICEILRESLKGSPNSHACVVCRHAHEAVPMQRRLAAILSEVEVRVGHNSEFAFAPGVTVTNMRQVKGLEFDTVIVLEPTEDSYPNTVEGQRWLYMVTTRAKDRLDFVGVGEACELLARARDAGYLEVMEETEVVAAEFSAEEEEPF